MKRLALLCLALGFVGIAVPAGANPQVPLDLNHYSVSGQGSMVLEKYNVWPWPTDPAQRVVNSSQCAWDINDHSDATTAGYLASGASTALQNWCIVWGYNPMYVAKNGLLTWWSSPQLWFGVSITAQSSGLTVQVCYPVQARCFTLTPVSNGRSYTYSLCSQVVYGPGDPALAVVPGSTPDPLPWGSAPGEGVVSPVVLSITNPTTKTIKPITAEWGISSDAFFSAGCSAVHPPVTSEYPFTWYP